MTTTPQTTLRVSLAQIDIIWEDKKANLAKMEEIIRSLSGSTEVVIFPEMCTTGFSMNVSNLAENIHGETITSIKKWAKQYDIAICGSFIAEEDSKNYNRAFFITSKTEHYYDKYHLFRMGKEPEIYHSGEKQVIFEHKGFNICLLVCYDLRFPVWSRNKDKAYDLLIYTASWPRSRSKVWNTLLEARAIENMAYVCGVNRVGTDGSNLDYDGSSKMIDAKGVEISHIVSNQEQVETVLIDKTKLEDFRQTFPAWMDADNFNIIK